MPMKLTSKRDYANRQTVFHGAISDDSLRSVESEVRSQFVSRLAERIDALVGPAVDNAVREAMARFAEVRP